MNTALLFTGAGVLGISGLLLGDTSYVSGGLVLMWMGFATKAEE